MGDPIDHVPVPTLFIPNRRINASMQDLTLRLLRLHEEQTRIAMPKYSIKTEAYAA